ncbi:RNA-guided endonuclease InsQ/TnpB family protein [Iningainema tapete]|uniref:Transposase n=1 Tax=Iningainema tapete BLCC-T55 TaxID=2748662 RepID=A0A8J6XCH0_9CYAN|nr:RNA-guided endonuclease TnpB family protein [Iningainema tapete]MBD2772449.1 transposase [Iningainema tapete BLCC-T55]
MLLNYQYRMYPDTNQKLELNEWLRTCRYWYNWQLGDRFDWWENNRTSINSCPLICSLPELRDNPDFYSQKKLLPIFKEDLRKIGHSGYLLDFKRVPSQTLQDVSKRVDEAFRRFVQGDSNGKKSGKPRFKNIASFRTMRFEGQAVTIERIEKDWLFLSISKLNGWLKVRLHRPLPDGFTLKNILVTKKADGWYCTIALEDPTVPVFNPDGIVSTWDNSIGIDAVLHENDYLATSEGEKLPSLKSFRKSQNRLAKVSRRKAIKKRGSAKRRKLAVIEAREHQRIARSRKDHAYKTAHKLVRTGKKVFFHEDLNILSLTKRNKAKKDDDGKFLPNGQSAKSGLNKSWLDASFGQFFTTLDYIASKAGAVTIKVKPAYTSQLLAYRDEFVFTDCSIRDYFDLQELLNVDRDINASINVKRVGLGLFPTIKSRRGKLVVTNSATASTSKEVLEVLRKLDTVSKSSVDGTPEAYTLSEGRV